MSYLQGRGLRMIQNIFKRMIDEIYIEYLKPNDWKKQGSNYRLFDDSGLGKIINFQKSKMERCYHYRILYKLWSLYGSR